MFQVITLLLNFCPAPLVLGFMMKQDTDNCLDMFLWFSDKSALSLIKNDLRIILGSKYEELKAMKLIEKLNILF